MPIALAMRRSRVASVLAASIGITYHCFGYRTDRRAAPVFMKSLTAAPRRSLMVDKRDPAFLACERLALRDLHL